MSTKRGKASQITRHPNLAEIELALANEITLDAIAEKYDVHRDAVWRHKRKMTPERMALLRYRRGDSPIDLEALKRGEAEQTVQRNIVLMAELWQLFRLAADTGDLRTAVRAAAEYRSYNELQAKLVGELVQGDRHLHLAVSDSPQYRRLVAIVMAWAADKPGLAADLAQFLEASEAEERAAPAVIDAKPINGHVIAQA